MLRSRFSNSIYTATKSAIDAITRTLAKELGPKQIRVNSINPGATATEGARAAGVIGVGSDFEKQLLAMTPLGGNRAALGHRTDGGVPDLRRGKLADGRDNFGLWRSTLGRHSQEETGLRKGDFN